MMDRAKLTWAGRLVTLLMTGALAACGGGGGGGATATSTTVSTEPTTSSGGTASSGTGATTSPAGSTTAGSSGVALLTAPANALNLSLVADSVQTARSAMIPVAGGSLSATGSNGTVYKLDIPANALVQDTTITMTPIASISNLTFSGGLGGAVKLEPEGLTFYKNVTLTMTPTKPIPLANQILFGFSGTGTDTIVGTPGSGDSITMLLGHFSGGGVGNGTSEEMAALLQRIATRVEARIESEVGNLLSEAKQNNTNPDAGKMSDLFNEFEASVVRNRITAAGAASASCADGKAAMQTLLGYERQRALLGMPPSAISFNGLMDSTTQKCRQEAIQQCKAQSKTEPLVKFELSAARQYALLGLTWNGPNVTDTNYYVKTCLGPNWVGTTLTEVTAGPIKWTYNTQVSFVLDEQNSTTSTLKYKVQTGSVSGSTNAFTSSTAGATCSQTAASGSASLNVGEGDLTIDIAANTYKGTGYLGVGRLPLPVVITCTPGGSAPMDVGTAFPWFYADDQPRPMPADGSSIAGDRTVTDAYGMVIKNQWTLTRQ